MKKSVLMAVVTMAVLASGVVTASAAGPAVDDSVIDGKVQTVIFREPTLRASRLSVSTRAGVVRLTGVVEKALDVEAAAALAGSVPGVVEVKKEFVAVKQ